MAQPTKQQQMDALAAEIVDNDICPELAATAQRLVVGDGNLDADIIFIGEAPGKKEDETGLPFVGASGKFLDEMLTSVNLTRQDVYITSIVKYRPPNNRDPKPAEKAAFWPYQLKQLEIIQPKVVVTLGKHSLGYFLPGAKIAEVHGQASHVMIDGMDLIVIPLFHPAAALYRRSLRQTLIDDFLKVPELIKQLGA